MNLHRARYEHHCNTMLVALENRYPTAIIQDTARLILEASYGGPWKMIAALIRKQAERSWREYAIRYEWFRTRILRRIPGPALEIAERVAEEEIALQEMANDLETLEGETVMLETQVAVCISNKYSPDGPGVERSEHVYSETGLDTDTCIHCGLFRWETQDAQ